jgi:hypothetical protein
MNAARLRQTRLLTLVLMVASLPCAGPAAPRQDLDSNGWQWSVTPYLWLSGLDGDVRIRETEVDVDVGFDDVWDAFDFGVQVHLEAQKGRFGLLGDTTYLSLSTDKELNIANAELEIKMWTVEFGGFYRLGDWSGARSFPSLLDVLVGGRYWNLDAELAIGPVHRESGDAWVDPFVGLRWMTQLTDQFMVVLRGDVGGFGIYDDASEFTWNVYAGGGVKLSKSLTVLAGYRALNTDRPESSNLQADLTLAGPEIGLLIQF